MKWEASEWWLSGRRVGFDHGPAHAPTIVPLSLLFFPIRSLLSHLSMTRHQFPPFNDHFTHPQSSNHGPPHLPRNRRPRTLRSRTASKTKRSRTRKDSATRTAEEARRRHCIPQYSPDYSPDRKASARLSSFGFFIRSTSSVFTARVGQHAEGVCYGEGEGTSSA
jgi:hypothetical protein